MAEGVTILAESACVTLAPPSLQIRGIRAKKLRYEDLVSSLAFLHCNGIVQTPVPKYRSETQTIEMVTYVKSGKPECDVCTCVHVYVC